MAQYVVDTNGLKKIMIDAGIETIAQLAENANVNRNTIAGILDGKIRPSTAVIEKIAQTLSMSTEQVGGIFFNQDLAKMQE